MKEGFINNGGAIIQSMIDEGVKNGSRNATVTGNYIIEKTIKIPSNFSLYLQDCHLVMADDTFCNMFTNERCWTQEGLTVDGKDENIVIEGRGRVILDGGNYNGLSERNSLKDGMPSIYRNNLVLFVNVEHFKVTGIHARNQRWWAFDFIFCAYGTIRDIDFLGDGTRIDENGNRVKGLYWGQPGGHPAIYIRNADGIDIRRGCHDILIENISGFTEDDTVALTCIPSKMHQVEGKSEDMYNVMIRNVRACSHCAIVRLLCQGGAKQYNILIDGVMDASRECDCLSGPGETGVRIGDNEMYGSRHATEDECYNIHVKNVYARTLQVLWLAGNIGNITYENINGFDQPENTPIVRDERLNK